MTSSQPTLQASRQDVQQFTLWMLEALRCEVTARDDGICEAKLPEPLQADWNGAATLRFHAASGDGEPGADEAKDPSAADSLQPADVSAKLLGWAVEKLNSRGPAVHAEPAHQPHGIHDLTPALFSHYEFPEGHVHLAGCTLQDRPLLRLSIIDRAGENGSQAGIRHLYLWPDGEPVDQTLRRQLELGELSVWEGRPPEHDEAQVKTWVDRARQAIGDEAGQRPECYLATLVWCKYAQGKLEITADDQSVYVPFAGWARLLADGIQTPPPYHCPVTGVDSYRLTMTHDGQIVPAEAVSRCEASGRPALGQQLETCSATGQKVLPEFLDSCAASGESVLSSQLAVCSQCQQRVSPNVLLGGRCVACRTLKPVSKDDPRMARLLDEYPRLDRWPRWLLSETPGTYVLLGRTWLRQVLLVVDKHTLEVRHLATSGRLLVNWQEMPPLEREELVSGG